MLFFDIYINICYSFFETNEQLKIKEMKRTIQLLTLSLLFFVIGITNIKAQSVSQNDLSHYYVNVRPHANYKYLQGIGQTEMIAVAKEYIKTGFVSNSRYSIELPQSGAFRTAVEMNPTARENARFKWAGRKYGILNPDRRVDHLLKDNDTGRTIVVGCGNEILSSITVSLDDYYTDSTETEYDNSYYVRNTVDTPEVEYDNSSYHSSTPVETSVQEPQYYIEDAPKTKTESSFVVKAPQKKIDFSGMGKMTTTEQKAQFLDKQISTTKTLDIKDKTLWKPFLLGRQVKMAPGWSVLVDVGGATLLALLAKKFIFDKKSSSGSDPVTPDPNTPDDFLPGHQVKYQWKGAP